jgi:hypothetical protein
MIKRIALFVVMGVCLCVFLVQAMTFFGLRHSAGFTRESWDGRMGVGYHTNRGVVDDERALYFFWENEQAMIQSPLEGWVQWEGAGSPPQFTTGATVLKDWTVMGTGYQYSALSYTYRSGQYHLVRVNSLLVLAASGIGVVSLARKIMRGRRRRKWLADGCCAACGYDLRAGHEVCPECGTAVACKA